MTRHWRKWWLLLKLQKLSIKESIEADQSMIGDQFVYVGINRFLSGVADKRLWFFERSKKSKIHRMAKDAAILDLCVKDDFIEKIHEAEAMRRAGMDDDDADDKFWIRITGKGSEFSDFTNALEGFVKNYPSMWAVIGALWIFGLWPIVGEHLLPPSFLK